MMLRILFLILFTVVSLFSSAQRKEDLKNSKPLYGFIENKGQVLDQDFTSNPDVKYILPLAHNNVILKSNGFSYDTYVVEHKVRPEQRKDGLGIGFLEDSSTVTDFKFHRIDIEFVGGDPNAKILSYERSIDFLTYYVGEHGTETKVYHYGKLIYKNVYPGIDIEFIARPGESKPVEYNFIVSPGADINQIQLAYNGAHTSELNKGKLEFSLEHGKLTESIPASFWKESKKSAKIQYKRISKPGSQICLGFSSDNKHRNETLVIDPTPNLDWGTYYGGSGNETIHKVTVDASSNVFVVGTALSANSIATSGTYQSVFGGGSDAFFVKFDSNGNRQWATYYGGIQPSNGYAIAVDGQGNIYISGSTLDLTGVATPGAFQTVMASPGVSPDGFIAKFNSSGSRQWGTYVGSISEDIVWGIVPDPSGNNVYVSGVTQTPSTVIASADAHQTSYGGGVRDAFLMKFSSDGNRIWGTFYGGSSEEFSYPDGLCLDPLGNVYLAGYTSSIDMISTPGAHQVSLSGSRNAFIAKFDSNGTRQWGTYYGGADGSTQNIGIASDPAGNIYAVGITGSTTAISSPGAHQQLYGGGTDAYIVKFNSSGVRQWGTYYGGVGSDYFRMIAVSSNSNLYAIGLTGSSSSIATPNSYQSTLAGGNDALIVKLDANGVPSWATYYGGPANEVGYSVALGNSGIVYAAGTTSSATMIATSGSHQTTYGGGPADGFIARFSDNTPCTAPEAAGLAITDTPYICAVKFTTNKLSNCNATYSWNFGDGGTSLERNPIHVYASAGTYNVSVQINYNCPSCQSQTTLTKQVVYAVPTSIMEDRVIDIVTTQLPEVIQTSASSFSDAWALGYSNNTLDNKNSFLNGSQGVWRNNASFVYEKERKLSPSTNIATDGTFTLEQFNWKSAELNGVPNWIKANSMTGYSPFSFELENQDVLGVYSGAIYDYGGQLPAANGVNMRQDEMAFTSFEFLDGTVAGNWIFASGSLPTYVDYKIQSGNKNMALVEASLAQLANVVAVDVVTTQTYSSTQPYKKTNYVRNEIVCIKAHPQNPAWSFVVLKTAPLEELWSGRLRVKNVVSTTGTSVFDNTIAHTGEKSLKVTSDITIKQDLLQLDENKSYWINSWVSVNNAAVATPVLASNLGIDIIAKLKNGQVISTFTFQPAGPVIEGWQQLKGSFICPLNTAYIEIKFKPGSTGTAWYDDVRLHPEKGNMKGYVYNLNDYRLQAVLDEENFASFFYYDAEGNLYLTKKETVDGVKTLSENISYQVER